MKLNNILFAFLFLAVLYFLFKRTGNSTENLDDTSANTTTTPQTIFGVRNAFTGLHCYDNNLPIVSVDSGILSCISKDGKNCLMRNELKIPDTVLCKNSEDKNNNVNTYLSKDGIRQVAGGSDNPNTKDIFNDLDSNGYYTIQCNQTALNTSGHWCNSIYNTVDTMCNSLDPISKSLYTECNGALATYKNTSPKDNSLTVSTLYKKGDDGLAILTCQNKDCIRSIVIPTQPQVPKAPVPDTSGNCDSISISRGKATKVSGGDIKCVAANADYNKQMSSYQSSLNDYNTKVALMSACKTNCSTCGKTTC